MFLKRKLIFCDSREGLLKHLCDAEREMWLFEMILIMTSK
jgi:hypothetical protein